MSIFLKSSQLLIFSLLQRPFPSRDYSAHILRLVIKIGELTQAKIHKSFTAPNNGLATDPVSVANAFRLINRHRLAKLFYLLGLSSEKYDQLNESEIHRKLIETCCILGDAVEAEERLTQALQKFPQDTQIIQGVLPYFDQHENRDSLLQILTQSKQNNFAWPIGSTRDLAKFRDLSIKRGVQPRHLSLYILV